MGKITTFYMIISPLCENCSQWSDQVGLWDMVHNHTLNRQSRPTLKRWVWLVGLLGHDHMKIILVLLCIQVVINVMGCLVQ